MTIAGYNLADFMALTTVVFGALTFSVLAVSYWRERRSRGRTPFAVFTEACAAAFCINLLLRAAPAWEMPLTVALDFAAGLLPPLLLHVILEHRSRTVRLIFYGIGASAASALAMDDLDFFSTLLRDDIPALMLGTAAVLGLALLPSGTRLQLWYRFLLVLTAATSGVSIFHRSAFTVLAPDYLLLAFFCVTLFYRERLIFFDLLIKRGIFFSFALATISSVLILAGIPKPVEPALALAALFVLAPWADSRLGAMVDRVFLRRRYALPAAERLFLNQLEVATSEEDLRARAECCLSNIFQGQARVRFEAPTGSSHDDAALSSPVGHLGYAALKPRTSGIPYMSDDRRLFESLARTLAVTLENVRFREQQQRQQEREQQLRLLASRAELKALRAQINPHFLFNALNAIAGLIPTQPELADRTVEQLAQVFRYTLRKSDTEWARLGEEVEFIEAYLRVEQARFGERLRMEIAIEPAAALVEIPAMCIQPLVENAVKHGASMVERGGLVGLRGSVENGWLRIEVFDNGPGFPSGFSAPTSAGHGLRNVIERLRGYYGNGAELSWSTDGSLTRVCLRVPIAAAVLPAARSQSCAS
jgi:signal transduction histidine kinase